jgi:hypothetical protein
MTNKRVLLINPTITKRRSARFPLAVLNLSAALDGKYDSRIIDGNVDRDFIATALRTLASEPVDAVGVSVMGGCAPPSQSRAPYVRGFPQHRSSGGGTFPPSAPNRASGRLTLTTLSAARERRRSVICSTQLRARTAAPMHLRALTA